MTYYAQDARLALDNDAPRCFTCNDRRVITLDASGQPTTRRDEPTTTTNCPDCNPTPEQVAEIRRLADEADARRRTRPGVADPWWKPGDWDKSEEPF